MLGDDANVAREFALEYFYSYIISVSELARAVMTWESHLATHVLTPCFTALLSFDESYEAFNSLQRLLGNVVPATLMSSKRKCKARS